MKHVPVFFSAPHRVMFLAGATNAVLAMLWWALELGARVAGSPLAASWTLPPSWAHGALMIFGVFPFFIYGFAFTAGPRWQGREEVKPEVFVPAFVAMSAGWLLFYAGLVNAALLVPALALVLVGWLVALREVWRIAAHPNPEKLHIRALAMALTAGAGGVAALLVQVSGGPAGLATWALAIGVWAFLLPVYATVSHRMIPFFTGSAIKGFNPARPDWALLLILAGGVTHGILQGLGLWAWTWLADVPAAVAAVYLSLAWQLRRSLSVRLLAMLHIGFAWLGIGLGLAVLQGVLGLMGIAVLGLGPLHALTIGFFASILVGMASRVTMGHSGGALVADKASWRIFVGLQLVALVRVAGEFRPDHLNHYSLLAALLWLAVFGGWWGRYGAILWRPRADGRPG